MSMYLKAIAFSVLLPAMAVAQSDDTVFDPANAILDTKILFATGAHEGQQSLRASFGWPTFQEGLVTGVYYRFDPDGYARFATSPRLDTDVFEVMCRARTHTCAARRGPLAFRLTDNGQVHMLVDGLIAGTQLSASDGVNTVQLPDSVLQPLSPTLENALAAARELIISHDQQATQTVRLEGLPAVLAYLRWVAAGQDYSVLPSNWPIPADGRVQNRTQTAPSTWRNPQDDNGLAALLDNADENAFAGTDNAQFEARVTPPVPSQILPPTTTIATASDPMLLAALARIERLLDQMQRRLVAQNQGAGNLELRRMTMRLDLIQNRLGDLEEKMHALSNQQPSEIARDEPLAMFEAVPSPATSDTGPQMPEMTDDMKSKLLEMLGVSAGAQVDQHETTPPVSGARVQETPEIAATTGMTREQELLKELAALRGDQSGGTGSGSAATRPGEADQSGAANGTTPMTAPVTSGTETVELERHLVEEILEELSAEAAGGMLPGGDETDTPPSATPASSENENDDGFQSLTDYLKDISPTN